MKTSSILIFPKDFIELLAKFLHLWHLSMIGLQVYLFRLFFDQLKHWNYNSQKNGIGVSTLIVSFKSKGKWCISSFMSSTTSLFSLLQLNNLPIKCDFNISAVPYFWDKKIFYNSNTFKIFF